MKYELKSYRTDGPPSYDDKGVINQPIIVVSGIVGDSYGFVKTDSDVAISSMSKTGTEIEADYKAAAQAFVAKKYPDTDEGSN